MAASQALGTGELIQQLVKHAGPFEDGNGNIYAVVGLANTPYQHGVMKAPAGGPMSGTWSEIDGTNRPTTSNNSPSFIDAYSDGDQIHLVQSGRTSGEAVTYSVFNMSSHATPDQWSITNETVSTNTNALSAAWVCPRSDGTVVCVWKSDERYKGNNYSRTTLKVRSTGGVWGSEVAVGPSGFANNAFPWITLFSPASDRVHIIYLDQPGGVIAHKAYSSGDVLSSQSTVFSGITKNPRIRGGWDGTNLYCTMYPGDGTLLMKMLSFPDAQNPSSFTESTNKIADSNLTTYDLMAMGSDGTDRYAAFMADTPKNLYYDKDPFGTDTLLSSDAEPSGSVSAEYLPTRNVIGIVYSHGLTANPPTYYNEIPLTSGTTQTITDPAGVSDAVSRVIVWKRTATDPAGITDLVATAKTIKVTISDTVGVIDAAAAARVRLRTVTDQVVAGDVIAAVKSASETIIDSAGVTDAVARTVAAARTITDQVGLADLPATVKTIKVTVTDTVGVADVVTPVKAGGVAIQRTVTDLVGVTDIVAPAKTITSTVIDPAGVTDATSRIVAFVRTVVDQVDLSDSVSENENNRETIIDHVDVIDHISRVMPAVRTITDGTAVTDQVATVIDAARTVADQIGVTDQVSPARTIRVTITDPVDVTDSTAKRSATARAVTDQIGVTDSVGYTSAGSIVRIVTDQVAVTDGTSRTHDAHRIVSDPAGITDVASTGKTITLTITEAVGVTDQPVPAKAAAAIIFDTIGVTDQTSRIIDFSRSIIDFAGIADQPSRIQTALRTILETVEATDSIALVFAGGPGWRRDPRPRTDGAVGYDPIEGSETPPW